MKNLFILLAMICINTEAIKAQQTKKRNVGTYDGIHIAGSYKVTLISRAEGTIELKGDEEDLEKIASNVKNGTLTIKQKEKSWFRTWDTEMVYITIPVEDIDKIILSGSGEIDSRFTLEGDHFKTIVSGSGNINISVDVNHLDAMVTGSGEIILEGDASTVDFTLTGSGEIEASGVEASTGKAKITGSGDIDMHASEILDAFITGSGDVVCKGNPKKQKTKITGSGDISVRD